MTDVLTVDDCYPIFAINNQFVPKSIYYAEMNTHLKPFYILYNKIYLHDYLLIFT